MAPTQLLNDDGTASMATMILMSHHAFRRDLAHLAAAIRDVDAAKAPALQTAWQWFQGALHGHHQKEDEGIFPHVAKDHPLLAATIQELSVQHSKIDPLLERGAAAFAHLPGSRAEASQVLAEVTALLDVHLDLEEGSVVPTLRGAREFPAPSNDDEAALYASGFAWSLDGIAPEVVARVLDMLPKALSTRIPAARQEYEVHRTQTWGSAHRPSASRSSIPEFE
jgi:hypothetical protein